MNPHINAHLIAAREQEIAVRAAHARHRGELDLPVRRHRLPWRRPVLRLRPLARFTALRVGRA
jgi:hypothetical protein